MKCIICSNMNYETISPRLRDSDSYSVVKCKKCSHIQLDPQPTIQEDQDYYNNNLQARSLFDKIDINIVRKKAEVETLMQFEKIRDYISKDKKVLEIGSGYGFFLEKMIEMGYDVEGLEISSPRAEFFKSDGRVVHNFNLLSSEPPKELLNRFDLICSFQVLEHISDPVLYLKNISNLLNDEESTLIIEVPNFDDHMIANSKGYKDFYFQRAHVSYYTKETLLKVLKLAGYTNIEVKGYQRYGIMNAMNWLINNSPQLNNPFEEICDNLIIVEDFYKKLIIDKYECDTIYAIATRK